MNDIQHTYDLNGIEELIHILNTHQWYNWKVVSFIGDLGSGKTTIIKKLCESQGVSDNISSPTYSIINEYKSELGPIYHIDLYRLKDIHEAQEIGIEDYLYDEGICLIEWPQIIEDIIPLPYLKIEIENLGKFTRRLHMYEIDAQP
ncbi:MAG: tRNA (adenosine(37)-N6)-threonylcarbamoyltransferase complex ATPase subunit type 1 TsaE [Saprospiraceae bacterium]|nr:tRNA (adenosine(37)-N6)-threonylcarbamoyltransferase complex ATPase subunit type 1 TsaE [Saprospiraceae bacterium]